MRRPCTALLCLLRFEFQGEFPTWCVSCLDLRVPLFDLPAGRYRRSYLL